MSGKESFVAMLISVVTDFLTGFLLGTFNHFFLLLPGLLILIPASISMRGNIFASLGSRIGTALHLGSIEKFDLNDKTIRQNIYATIYITVVMSILLGVVSSITSLVFHIRAISIMEFISISFLAGMISGVFMLVATFFISFKSYEKNYDPDNVTSPLITGLGDLFTLPAIFLSGFLILNHRLLSIFLFVLFLGISVFFIFIEYRKDGRVTIIKQSIPILIICSLIGMVSGVSMQHRIETLSLYPSILMMIPVFLEEGGNIGNIFSSRLSTKLHLGAIEPKLGAIFDIRDEIALSAKLWVSIFPLVGFATFWISKVIGLSTPSLTKMVLISTLGGFILSLLIVVVTFLFSILSYRKGLDPDNVSIPILTSVADAVGIIVLLAVAESIL